MSWQWAAVICTVLICVTLLIVGLMIMAQISKDERAR